VIKCITSVASSHHFTRFRTRLEHHSLPQHTTFNSQPLITVSHHSSIDLSSILVSSLIAIQPDLKQQLTKYNLIPYHQTTMAGTRQSARNASQGNSSPPAATPTNGTKRKAEAASPTSNKKKQQKTLEEVIPDEAKREEVKAALANEDGDEKANGDAKDNAETEDANGGAGRLINGV
jgi:hypothetical protein